VTVVTALIIKELCFADAKQQPNIHRMCDKCQDVLVNQLIKVC